MHGGQLEVRFLARKISEVEPIRVHFGLLIGGSTAHRLNHFFELKFSCNSKNRRFSLKFRNCFRKSVPRYSRQILSLVGLGAPRITHSKIWTPALRFFLEIGEKLFWGPGAKICCVVAPPCPRSTARLQRSPIGRVESFRGWVGLIHSARPGIPNLTIAQLHGIREMFYLCQMLR